MAIDIGQIKTFLSADGQRQIVDFVRQARDERGAGWLESITAEYPTFAWLADLVVNHSAEDAYRHLQNEFPLVPLSFFKQQIFDFHQLLLSEIDKPRG